MITEYDLKRVRIVDRLKSKINPVMVAYGLLVCIFAGSPDYAFGKSVMRQTNPYAKEIVRRKDRVEISRTIFDAVKTNSAVILSGVAVRQRTDKAGRPAAWELVQVDRGSTVSRMGFRSGDRLIMVNGILVGELESRRTELETCSRWELIILRQEKQRKLIIEVKD